MVQMKYKDAIPDLSFNSSLVEYLKRMNSVVQQSIDNISLETDDIDKALNSHVLFCIFLEFLFFSSFFKHKSLSEIDLEHYRALKQNK